MLHGQALGTLKAVPTTIRNLLVAAAILWGTVPASSQTSRSAGDALRRAVRSGILDQVKALLDKVVSPNALDDFKNPTLATAAENNKGDIAQLLLARGAQCNARGQGKQTPLHYAAKEGHKEMVELLVTHGTIVDARDGGERTPLHLAIGRCQTCGTRRIEGVDRGIRLRMGQTAFPQKTQGGDSFSAEQILRRRFHGIGKKTGLLVAHSEGRGRGDFGRSRPFSVAYWKGPWRE